MKVEYDWKWVVRCWVQNMVDCIETCSYIKGSRHIAWGYAMQF